MKKLSISAILLFTLTSAGCKTISGEDALGVISIVALATVLFDDDDFDSDNDYSYTKPKKYNHRNSNSYSSSSNIYERSTSSSSIRSSNNNYQSASLDNFKNNKWFPSKGATNCLTFIPSTSKHASFVGKVKNRCPYKLVVKDGTKKAPYNSRTLFGKEVYYFHGGLGTVEAYGEKTITQLNGRPFIYAACRYKNAGLDYTPYFTNNTGTRYSCLD